MATRASTARSNYGIACAQCGDGLIAPEWSECVGERHVRHLWQCANCGCQFETSAYIRDAAGLKMGDTDWEEVFPFLLVA
jgi:ribosomal protein L37AE/L43A